MTGRATQGWQPVQVGTWGAALYGDPCAECGYEWSLPRGKAVDLVAAIADRYTELLAGTDGRARHPDLDWNAGAYVCHVGDNLRIWAERLAGAAGGDATAVPGYDADLLGRARDYNLVPVDGALWSLYRAARGWIDAVDLATHAEVVLRHAGRGEQRVDDVVSNNAHDAFHHGWDIQRSLEHDGVG
jgi:hypothetical protein